MVDYIKLIEEEHLKKDTHDFKVGDTLKVQFKVIEGDKERLQTFEGICIERKNKGINESFTLRRIASHGVGVEKTILIHSPILKKIQVIKKGKVKRARLYYLREKIGKERKIRERK